MTGPPPSRQQPLPDLGGVLASPIDVRRAATADSSLAGAKDEESSAATGSPQPGRAVERACRAEGARRIAGVDEVGRGALAGPVTAAAVILPWTDGTPDHLTGVRDSKQLAPAARARLALLIREHAQAVGVGHVWPKEIDMLGIARATALAMRRALLALPERPDIVLVDGLPPAGPPLPAGGQRAIVRGDRSELSIAAASIVAKAERDAWMVALAERRPDYGYDGHKGYAAPRHLRAIALCGPTPEHRLSWRTFSGPRQGLLPGWTRP
jgi:ribonuclease HII